MKTLRIVALATVGLFFAAQAAADLEVYKDYDLGTEIISMTTIKVDANMGDLYLEGLKETWVASNEVAKSLGHIENYRIFGSELPESGDFNLVLLVYFKNAADLEPSKRRYNAFMKKWGEKAQESAREISSEYPKVRTITGEYRLREIMLK
ncbi:MAG: hypothetical protein AAF515_15875 [Pseudomonadota bacterium]